VDESTGQLEIHIVNGGHATWAGRDLEVIARWPSGTMIGRYTFPELVLRPGETTILKHPDLRPRPHPPLGACILLDPGNAVPEEEDYSPDVWRRGEYCRPLPDLTITDVVLDEGSERLLVTVHNAGSGSIDDRSIDLSITLTDGRTMVPEHAWDHITLEPHRSSLFIWDGLNTRVRDRLRGGYEVIVDPYNDIAETDGMNNSFLINPGGNYQIYWTTLNMPYYEFISGAGRHVNEVSFNTGVMAESGTTARLLADWEAPGDEEFCTVRLNHELTFYDCLRTNYRVDAVLDGDEDIVFYFEGRLRVGPYESGLGGCINDCDHSLGSGSLRVTPSEWVEAPACGTLGGEPFRFEVSAFPPGLIGEHYWHSYYRICRLE
jgi:hypothetical protein